MAKLWQALIRSRVRLILLALFLGYMVFATFSLNFSTLHSSEITPAGVSDNHVKVGSNEGDKEGDNRVSFQNHFSQVGSERVAEIERRRLAVKEGFQHAWKGYKEYAWGHDELKPKTKRPHRWMGLGVSIVDSLDTMFLMNMTQEFEEAKSWTISSLKFGSMSVSVFETTIRILGGLLSAYELSGDQQLLDKAKDIGDRLFRAFKDNSPYPLTEIHLQGGHGSYSSWARGNALLSEVGTLQVEFAALSHHTNDPKYAKKAFQVYHTLKSLSKPEGLYPVYLMPSGDFAPFDSKRVTLGALGDSYYEYLLKTWLLLDKKVDTYIDMYLEATDAITKLLLERSSPSGLLYIAERSGGHNMPKMDHLVCFAGGMFALGAHHMQKNPQKFGTKVPAKHMEIGKELTRTCYEMYHRMPTGIAPEIVRFDDSKKDMSVKRDTHYILRPETVESLFVLYRVTGDPKYQDWGWEIFQSLNKHCRVEAGYSGIRDVTQLPVIHDDVQQSFFLAETLKYLYLLFTSPNVVPIDDYVFNTEAHPLRVIRGADF